LFFESILVRVPVCGAIIVNETFDKVLLVKGWSSKSSWGFPKGKINKDEPEIDCAIREVNNIIYYVQCFFRSMKKLDSILKT
jgi:8-oxo-dGTP pyrophosphatase MutT (NUDIX family)